MLGDAWRQIPLAESTQLEFADALNVSPERLAEDRRRTDVPNSPNSPRGRLRNDSVIQQQRGEARTSVGKGGRRISQLPGLGIAKGLRFGKKRKGGSAWDLERDAPDVHRCEPHQDPLERARTCESNARTERTVAHDRFHDDISEMSTNHISGRSSPSSRHKVEDHEGAAAAEGEGEAPAKSPDFDSIDFQTKPAGL